MEERLGDMKRNVRCGVYMIVCCGGLAISLDTILSGAEREMPMRSIRQLITGLIAAQTSLIRLLLTSRQ